VPHSASTPCCSPLDAPIRSTAGRSRSPWARSSLCPGPAFPTLSSAGFTTIALTLAEGAAPIEQAVAGLDRVALVLGSEGHGLSQRWEGSADRRAVIPMREGIDSLNVAAATAVACYVTARR
jgi:tRNA G18 (ribose-2'-O)-methylase SpoU